MVKASSGIEADLREIAAEIARGGTGQEAKVFHLSWWSERMLDWAMAHPAFKTQLFRFVDVFPACRTNAEIERHLEEYFDGVEVPRAVDLGLEIAEHTGPLGAAVSAAVARRNIVRMAHLFVAGETPAEALEPLSQLWGLGEAFTVDLLGEKTVTLAEADAYARRVVEMLDALSQGTASWTPNPLLERDPWGDVPRVNVSIKPTALAPLLGPLTREEGLAQAMERLHPILARARDLGATVHFDMEHYDVKDVTHELIRRVGEAFPDGPHIGAVVQAYLRDSLADLHDLIAWSGRALRHPLQVRLVKGAYWDYETAMAAQQGWPSPVYAHKAETDLNFERCVDAMVDGAGAVRPAFGSHNLRSLAYAVARARAAGLADDAFELQLLYGMAEPVHAGLRSLGLRVRVYTPIGDLVPGMAYLIRRLLENTSNESFVRMRFAEGADLDLLLAEPVVPSDSVEPSPDRSGYHHAPHAEYRRATARARMGSAVDGTAASLGFVAPMVIGGKKYASRGEIVSSDPGHTDALVCRSAMATRDDADRAVAIVQRAQPAWGAFDARTRAGVLARAAAIMRERRHELAALEVFEAGKPWIEADADVAEAVDFLEYYARGAVRLSRGGPVESPPGESNAYRYEPRGVGVAITPWNFPLAIPTGMVAGPLAVGNGVILKPAEQTPGVAYRLVQILHEAGLPPGVLAFLPGVGEEVGAHLVEHPDVSFITFTGSKAVGLQIIEAAARPQPGQGHVKRVVAEMGGKNAIIIDEDADLDVAVPAVVASAFGYAGQKCSACSRLVVLGAVFDEVVDRLVGATALVPVGHPRAMGTVVGPLIDEEAFERVRGYQDVAAKEGEVVLRRDDVPTGGWYVGPTVAVTSATARVATEEIFGPLLAVIRVGDFDEALSVANATDYGLTGGIFSRSPSRIGRATTSFRCGNLYVNRAITGAVVGRQPFGGIGLSGIGSKAGGPDYLLQFVEPRVVTENTIRQGFAPHES
ncbi:MAG TPA: proline dehydrogenase family protein [Acidimicrobiia bacterium]|nr:proline dehydrogenase family protein [Acidimicrobiia bacterium]